MDFEPCFKVYNLVSIRPKSMKLGQMTNPNMIFHMVGSVYRLVTIRNSPQFPVEFRNGLLTEFLKQGIFSSNGGSYSVYTGNAVVAHDGKEVKAKQAWKFIVSVQNK